jgi:hypothetical protein
MEPVILIAKKQTHLILTVSIPMVMAYRTTRMAVLTILIK